MRTRPTESEVPTIDTTASQDRAPTGRNLIYTIRVTNNGPDPAEDVTISDQLPPSVEFVSSTASVGSCGESSGTVPCTVGTMSNGDEVTIDIVVRPTVVGLITNTASLSSVTSDPNPDNNADSESTSVCRITSRRTAIPCG
jgi:uncharacterized repeat protein (TIGR01451 family)